MHTLLKDYTNYNLWANKRIATLFEKESESLLQQEVKSSFPSVWKTILHLWDAELIWLSRLKGVSPEGFQSKQFSGSKEVLIKGWLANSADFNDFVNQQKEDFFTTPCSYHNTTGKQFQQNSYEIIQHCMNHSTFHRGQLVTLARTLRLTEIPSTDLIFYYREVKTN